MSFLLLVTCTIRLRDQPFKTKLNHFHQQAITHNTTNATSYNLVRESFSVSYHSRCPYRILLISPLIIIIIILSSLSHVHSPLIIISLPLSASGLTNATYARITHGQSWPTRSDRVFVNDTAVAKQHKGLQYNWPPPPANSDAYHAATVHGHTLNKF